MLNNVFSYLHKENYKSAYLSIFRVVLALFLLKEIGYKIPFVETLYSNQSIFQFSEHSSFKIWGINYYFIKQHYLVLISCHIFFLMLFLFGVGKHFSTLMVFISLLLLQKLNNSTLNGGDKMARLILFYFIFANSFEYFCLKPLKNKFDSTSNLISNLAVFSIMMQLCIAYFETFLNKISNPYWVNGSAMYYVFNTESHLGTKFNQTIAKSDFVVYCLTYFTLAFELLFPFLIWVKKTRFVFIVCGILFHLGIYFFMMIYNLQILFLLPYGLFYSNSEIKNFVNKKLKLNFFNV